MLSVVILAAFFFVATFAQDPNVGVISLSKLNILPEDVMTAGECDLFLMAAPSVPLSLTSCAPPLPPFPAYHSGCSHAGDFAHQFHVAYSELVNRGSCVFSGQPYHCAVTKFTGDELVTQTDESR